MSDEMAARDELRAYLAGAFAAGLPAKSCESLVAFGDAIDREARADALREAAEKVRALPLRQGGTGIQTYRAEVLAIMEPQSEEQPR